MKKIVNRLGELNIAYVRRDHDPVFTVEAAEKYFAAVAGGHTKNLFLRNKDKSQYYLAVVEATKTIDLNKLAKQIGESRLSFGSEEMMYELLDVKPGSVSPFGLMFDIGSRLKVLIDQDLWMYDSLHFHPNVNTVTLEISSKDFQKFLDYCGHEVVSIEIPVLSH